MIARRGPGVHIAGAAAVLVTAAVLVLGFPLPASAHAYIVKATPAQDSTITRPLGRVTLIFDENLLDFGRNAIGIIDPTGRQVATGCATVDGPRLSVPMRLTSSGTYQITWRASSADGHLVGDSYTFHYRAPTGAATSAAVTSAPSCAPIGVAAKPGSAGIPTAAIVAIAASGAVLVLVLVAAGFVLLAVRRSDRPTKDDRVVHGEAEGG